MQQKFKDVLIHVLGTSIILKNMKENKNTFTENNHLLSLYFPMFVYFKHFEILFIFSNKLKYNPDSKALFIKKQSLPVHYNPFLTRPVHQRITLVYGNR